MESKNLDKLRKTSQLYDTRKECLLPWHEINRNIDAFVFWLKGGKNLEML